MARARNIKPSFFKNEQLVELPMATRLLFIGLWCLADREGRLEDRPKRIKMELFPGDDVSVDRALTELHNHGFIERYDSTAGRCIEVINFLKHQNPHHKEAASTLPKPEIHPHIHEDESPGPEPRARRGKPRIKGDAKGGRTPLIPDSGSFDARSLNPESPLPSKSSAAARRPADQVQVTHDLWNAYAGAYRQRYGTDPVRNAKVNGMLAQFMRRVPATEAPEIAAFYVGHQKGLYVSARHCVDLLLRDAEGLRTEWFTGRRVTEAEARQADRTAATGNAFNELIDESRRVA